jgi:hypothetical protein
MKFFSKEDSLIPGSLSSPMADMVKKAGKQKPIPLTSKLKPRVSLTKRLKNASTLLKESAVIIDPPLPLSEESSLKLWLREGGSFRNIRKLDYYSKKSISVPIRLSLNRTLY